MIQKVLIIAYKIENEKPLFFIGERPETGVHQPPTGHVEKEENYPDGAIRELAEELGVKHYRNFIDLHESFNFSNDEGENEEHVVAVEISNEKIILEKAEFSSGKFLCLENAIKLLKFDNHVKYLKLARNVISSEKYSKIFIVCGPSGSGKDTVIENLLDNKSLNLTKLETVTTREKRGEHDNKTHVTKKEFGLMKNRGDFIEKNFFNNNWYATPREPIESAIKAGENLVTEIDLNGVVSLKKNFTGVVAIFLKANFEDLRRRLLKRGLNSAENIAKRIDIAKVEMRSSGICDYIVENREGKLNETIDDVIKIVKGKI